MIRRPWSANLDRIRSRNPRRSSSGPWQASNRSDLRRAIAEKWIEETPYTNYRYNVERCENGNRIYLLRPTFLNKGFDFMVNVEGLQGPS